MKKISAEEYWKWDKFEGETSAEDMKEDFKRYVKEHYGKNIEFVESDNPDTFEALFPTQHKKYDISKVKTITLNGKKYIDMSVIEDIKTYVHNYIILSESEEEKLIGFIDRKIKEIKHECSACTHSDEVDGERCYECVKGLADNFEEVTKNDN